MSKILPNRIVIVIDRTGFGWEGSLSVDGREVFVCIGPSAREILDTTWPKTFLDELGSEAIEDE